MFFEVERVKKREELVGGEMLFYGCIAKSKGGEHKINMPTIRSAKKKMRQDNVRTARNTQYKEKYKLSIKNAKKQSDKRAKEKGVREAYSAIDKAKKKKILHANKASRLKSQVARS